MTTAAVVLAAGAGSRFAGPGHKLLAPVRGRPVVAWAVAAAHQAGLDETVVVAGAADLAAAGLPAGITVLANPRWRDGLAASLAVALIHARRRGHRAVVVGLGDQPTVAPAAWRAVAACAADLAVATYGGRRGHPVRLGRALWRHLPAIGEAGARGLLAGGGPGRVVEVACAGPAPADVDRVSDLEELMALGGADAAAGRAGGRGSLRRGGRARPLEELEDLGRWA